MSDRVNALRVIQEQLPKFFEEPHTEGLRNVVSAVMPQDLTDVGLALVGMPGASKLAKLGGLGLAGMACSPEAEAGGLSALKRFIVGSQDIQQLREALKHITGRRPSPQDEEEWRRVTMANELVANAEEPGVRTHAFIDPNTGMAKGAYQLKAQGTKTYLPYLVSGEKGLGRELMKDARFMTPTDELELYAIPGSEGFYRRMGLTENRSDGISKFRSRQ